MKDKKKKILDLINNGNIISSLSILKQIKDSDVFNMPDDKGQYLIFYYVNANIKEGVEHILDNGGRLDLQDPRGETVIFSAINFNNLNIHEVILNNNKNIVGQSILEIPNQNNIVPINYAVKLGREKIVKKMIKYHNPVNTLDNEGNNSLHNAVISSNINLIKYLLKAQEIDIHFPNKYGNSPLHLATSSSNYQICKLLLENNASPNQHNFESQYETPIHLAVFNDNPNIFELFLSYGDLNIQNEDGKTPLHLTISANEDEHGNFNIELTKTILQILNNQSKNNNLKYNCNLQEMNRYNTFLYNFLAYQIYISTPADGKINIEKIKENIDEYYYLFNYLLDNTNLNLENWEGKSSLYLILQYDIYKIDFIREKLLNQNLDLSSGAPKTTQNLIQSFNKTKKNEILEIAAWSYYRNLKKNPNFWKNSWENKCSKDNKKKDLKKWCLKKIYDELKLRIKNNDITFPHIEKSIINLHCPGAISFTTFTGHYFDIISGCLLLMEKHNYYLSPLNIDVNNKSFSFEIKWIINEKKLIITNQINSFIKNNKNRFSLIYLGIINDEENFGHANIIILDKEKMEVERFEPHGNKIHLYFKDLDKELKQYMQNLFPNIVYYSPKDYQRFLGIQELEEGEILVGELEGYCVAWSLFYGDMRLTFPNINRKKLEEMLFNSLIRLNKYDNSPKTFIINYTKDIVEKRDRILNKANITINNLTNHKYTKKQYIEILKGFEQELKKIMNNFSNNKKSQ